MSLLLIKWWINSKSKVVEHLLHHFLFILFLAGTALALAAISAATVFFRRKK